MSSIQLPRIRRRVLLTLATGCLVVCTAAGVQARDESGGFGSIFGQLFGRPQPAATAVQAPPAAAESTPDRAYYRQRARRHARSAPVRPRTRYVALPQPETVKAKLTEKAKGSDKAKAARPGPSNPIAALMRDETLRPGDIVVMPDGPKVFKGDPGDRHKISDFQDVRRSPAVDRKTRQLLLAMMVPVGAMPADEARKQLAKLRQTPRLDAGESTPLQVRVEATTSLRVISLSESR